MELIAGHTMGTPEYTVEEAMELFAGIGLDGIEIVVQDDYRCGIPNHVDEVYLQKIKDAAKHSNIRSYALHRIIAGLMTWMMLYANLILRV